MPGATVGDAGVTELQFPWMNSASIPLRQRVAPAVALKNPEKLQFTQHTPRDPLAKQREQNALWDKQTGGPTGDRINPVAVLIDANKDRVKPIETGNPVFNLEQSMSEEMRQPLQDFAFIGPTEMENKLMPASDMAAAEAIIEARAKGEPDPLTPELQALVEEQQQLLASAGKTMADLEAEYPTSSFLAIEPAPAPPPPAVEEAPPARLDPRDYRLQEEPQPMFAGLIPPAITPQVSEEAPTLREEIIAAMMQPDLPPALPPPPPVQTPPPAALPTSEAIVESAPEAVAVPEEPLPMQLDPRDYRLQEEPQPMFAGLVPPSQQPQPIMEAPTLREEIIAAMVPQETPAAPPPPPPVQLPAPALPMSEAVVEEAPEFVPIPEAPQPVQIDPRDYRLQEELQPMFAGLQPPSAAVAPAQPEATVAEVPIRDAIVAAIAAENAPVESAPISDAELAAVLEQILMPQAPLQEVAIEAPTTEEDLASLFAMLEEEGRG
jgi:hypothetical protein